MAERDLQQDIQRLRYHLESLGSAGTQSDVEARIGDTVKRRIMEESITRVVRDAMKRVRLEGVLLGLRHANREEVTIEGEKLSDLLDSKHQPVVREWNKGVGITG